MWTNGSYRVRFKHLDEINLWTEDVMSFLRHAKKLGQLNNVNEINNRIANKISHVTIAILEKKLIDGNLIAYAKMATGYSFCSNKDTFSKKTGRKKALHRALTYCMEQNIKCIELHDIYMQHFCSLSKTDSKEKKSLKGKIARCSKGIIGVITSDTKIKSKFDDSWYYPGTSLIDGSEWGSSNPIILGQFSKVDKCSFVFKEPRNTLNKI